MGIKKTIKTDTSISSGESTLDKDGSTEDATEYIKASARKQSSTVNASSSNSESEAIQSDYLKFHQLVKSWHEEIGLSSSGSEIVSSPSYLSIIAMGKSALPLILQELRDHSDDPDHWFVALQTITGENPVPEEAYGDTVRMAQCWLTFADRNAW